MCEGNIVLESCLFMLHIIPIKSFPSLLLKYFWRLGFPIYNDYKKTNGGLL